MRGSARDKAPAASVASALMVAEGRRPEGAAGCTTEAGTAGGAEKGAGAASAAPVASPTGAEQACSARGAGPEPAAEDDADVLTAALPMGPSATCPPLLTAVPSAGARRLNTRIGGVADRYTKKVEDYIVRHRVIERIGRAHETSKTKQQCKAKLYCIDKETKEQMKAS